MPSANLSIGVQPSVSGQAHFLRIAGKTKNHAPEMKLVLRLDVRNDGDAIVRVVSIEFTFPGSAVASQTMQTGPFFDVEPGKTVVWTNGKIVGGTNVIYRPLPAPPSVKVWLYCDGYSDPSTITLPLAHHASPVPGKAYLFPFSEKDLMPGEYFVTSAQHWANGGVGGTQIFAHDINVQSMDHVTEEWTTLLPGTSGSSNEHFRIWGKPVRSCAKGTVISWLDTMGSNVPGSFPVPTPKPVFGNHVWIRHGDERVVYCHFQPGTIPEHLKREGADVKAWEALGLAGNSGNSTQPHMHIHCVRDDPPRTLRPMPFRKAWVNDRGEVSPADASGPWVLLSGEGVPRDKVAIWPGASAPWP